MKKVLILLVLAVFAKAGYSQAPAAPELASIKWATTVADFGKVKQGVPVSTEFKFTNTGKVPLIITNVQPSCGCTTPDWSREQILPGKEGYVKATYNAAAAGIFEKSITVTANIEGGTVPLRIKGEVVPAAQ